MMDILLPEGSIRYRPGQTNLSLNALNIYRFARFPFYLQSARYPTLIFMYIMCVSPSQSKNWGFPPQPQQAKRPYGSSSRRKKDKSR